MKVHRFQSRKYFTDWTRARKVVEMTVFVIVSCIS